MSDPRPCRIKGCESTHPRKHFCSRTHWYQLPKGLRDEIWGTLRVHGVFSVEYLQAAENAEAFLEDREAEDMAAVL